MRYVTQDESTASIAGWHFVPESAPQSTRHGADGLLPPPGTIPHVSPPAAFNPAQASGTRYILRCGAAFAFRDCIAARCALYAEIGTEAAADDSIPERPCSVSALRPFAFLAIRFSLQRSQSGKSDFLPPSARPRRGRGIDAISHISRRGPGSRIRCVLAHLLPQRRKASLDVRPILF